MLQQPLHHGRACAPDKGGQLLPLHAAELCPCPACSSAVCSQRSPAERGANQTWPMLSQPSAGMTGRPEDACDSCVGHPAHTLLTCRCRPKAPGGCAGRQLCHLSQAGCRPAGFACRLRSSLHPSGTLLPAHQPQSGYSCRCCLCRQAEQIERLWAKQLTHHRGLLRWRRPRQLWSMLNHLKWPRPICSSSCWLKGSMTNSASCTVSDSTTCKSQTS